ncbi:hypothetical protein CCYA_CCYA04G1365 [Cyanidiococcus yangmingshanensis]|nr:hypothetical protein CCYA_CCYA04G1365 [Cyanidiococcus yangmingshanensis]
MESVERQHVPRGKALLIKSGCHGRQRTVQASVWPCQREQLRQKAAAAESPVSSSSRVQWWRQRVPTSAASGARVGYVSPGSTSLNPGTTTGHPTPSWKVLVRDRPVQLRVRCLPRVSASTGTSSGDVAIETEEAERSRWRELFREIILLNEGLLKPSSVGSAPVTVVGRRSPSPALLPPNWASSEDAFRLRLNEINRIMMQRWHRKRGLGGGGGLWGLLGFGPWADIGAASANSNELSQRPKDELEDAASLSVLHANNANRGRELESSGRATPLRWLERIWDFIWEQVGLPTIESPPDFVLDAVKRAAVTNWERELAERNPFGFANNNVSGRMGRDSPALGARSSAFLGGGSVTLVRTSETNGISSFQNGSDALPNSHGVASCRADADASEARDNGVESELARGNGVTSATAPALPARSFVVPEPRRISHVVEDSERWPIAVMSHGTDAYEATLPPMEAADPWASGRHDRTAKAPVRDPNEDSLVAAKEVSVLSYVSKDEEYPIYDLVAIGTPYGPAVVVFENPEDAYDCAMNMDETLYPHITFETVDKRSALECCYYEGSHLLWIPSGNRMPANVTIVRSFARNDEPNALRAPFDWYVCAAEKMYPDDDLSAEEAQRRRRIQAETDLLNRGFLLEPLPGDGRHRAFDTAADAANNHVLLFSVRPRKPSAVEHEHVSNTACVDEGATKRET